MREKHITFHEVVTHSRITPAYAGKTPKKTLNDDITRDHPRVCGKNHPVEDHVPIDVGSPPRMREKH